MHTYSAAGNYTVTLTASKTENWALEQKIKTYEQSKKSISRFDLQKILVHEVKPSNE
jgi:PKD repeat protein